MKKSLQSIIGISLLLISIYYFVYQYNSIKSDSKYGDSLNNILSQSLSLWLEFVFAALFIITAYLLRAHRWKIMLNQKDCFWLSFRSISIGYLVQIPLSKFGEVIRIANQNKFSEIPLAKIISTIFIDRLLDTASLLIFIILMFAYNNDMIQQSFPEFKYASYQLVAILVILFIALVFILTFHTYLVSRIDSSNSIPLKLKDNIIQFLTKMEEGTQSLKSLPKIFYMLLSSALIWTCYFLSFYVILNAYHQLSGIINLSSVINIFTVTSIGAIIPVPGSAGYVIFLERSLMDIYNVDHGVSLGIAFVSYIVLLCGFNLVIGGGSILYQLLFNKYKV